MTGVEPAVLCLSFWARASGVPASARRHEAGATGREELGVARSGRFRTAQATTRRPGPLVRGWPAVRHLVGAPGAGASVGMRTDGVRGSGRLRRKKWLYDEKSCDVPETDAPDPSLGKLPRAESPATRCPGASRPIANTRARPVDVADGVGKRDGPGTWSRRRSRSGSIPPGFGPSPASGQGRTSTRRGRVHRGEPLLLGVDKEYQISLRHFTRPPLRAFRQSGSKSGRTGGGPLLTVFPRTTLRRASPLKKIRAEAPDSGRRCSNHESHGGHESNHPLLDLCALRA